jgi:putative tricarboxylic transport membrane protein
MDFLFLDVLGQAFANVLTPYNLLLIAIGVLAGLIAGAVPGFTIAMAVILTLPFTFLMPPVQGLSMMMGVFVGGLAGGLVPGILVGIPGTPSSVATTFDGFPMARNGKPGLALGIGIWSCFFGGVFSAVLLAVFAPALSRVGLEFGPWDYFALVLFALTITASLAGTQLLKGLIAGCIGLLIAAIGEDSLNGVARLTFGFRELNQGFSFLAVLIGLFAFSQLLTDVRDPEAARKPMALADPSAAKVPHLEAIRTILADKANLLRSSLIGTLTGILPAAGGSIANILAYDQAKKASKTPEKFGTGTPEGVVASESANNATAGGALITMMALGIPGDVITAVMLGALLVHNVAPSPSFIPNQPVLAYSIIVAFFVANFMMLFVQVISLRMFTIITRIPLYILASVILIYCAIGVFNLNNVTFDIWALFAFGVLGYLMKVHGFPIAPVILGVVLGPVAEQNLVRAVSVSSDWTLFLTRPWSLFFLTLAAFSAIFVWYQAQRYTHRWTLAYPIALLGSLSVPMLMMPGMVRPGVGIFLVALAIYLVWRRQREGWSLPQP